MHTANLLDRLAPELIIPFILKNLSIQDLKKCCSINDIWKDEVIREIHRRLIVDCTFIDDRVTFKVPNPCITVSVKRLPKKFVYYY
jgi:hypothetical protein